MTLILCVKRFNLVNGTGPWGFNVMNIFVNTSLDYSVVAFSLALNVIYWCNTRSHHTRSSYQIILALASLIYVVDVNLF